MIKLRVGYTWNVRAEIDGDVKFTISSDDYIFIICQERDNWLQIYCRGYVGYIYMNPVYFESSV